MSRNLKTGLDYFPHDVDMSNDEKIQMIEAEFGLTGYAVFLKLLERIYRNGYFLPWDSKIKKLFCRNNNIEIDVCENIINVCILEKIFNKNLFDVYGILTSKGIQIRYLEATGRRKEVVLYREFLLLDNKNPQNVNIISLNVDGNRLNYVSGTQRKGKERKGNGKEKNVTLRGFFLFSSNYPVKNGMAAAEEYWPKIPDIETLAPTFPDIIKNQIKDKEFKREHDGFAPAWPSPFNWLKGKRWTDEVNIDIGPPPVEKKKCVECGKMKSNVDANGWCWECVEKLKIPPGRLKKLAGKVVKDMESKKYAD